MSKETAERISLIIETIAFFLVTIELYGEKRLQELYNRIKKLKKPKASEVITHLVFEKSNYLIVITLVISSLSLYLSQHINFKQLFYINSIGFWNNTLYFIIAFIVDILLLYVFSTLFYLFVGLVANFSAFCIGLLQKKSLKYYMLIGGAGMFLIAKIIQYVCV